MKSNTWKKDSKSGANSVHTEVQGDGEHFISAKLTSSQYTKLLEMLDTPSTIEAPSSSACLAGKTFFNHHLSSWILDTGATDHMC